MTTKIKFTIDARDIHLFNMRNIEIKEDKEKVGIYIITLPNSFRLRNIGIKEGGEVGYRIWFLE